METSNSCRWSSIRFVFASVVCLWTSMLCVCAGTSSVAGGVELAFEDKYQGFFVRSGHDEDVQSNGGAVVSRDQFLVLQPSRATMVRVGYGPFTAKQTVPYPSSLPLVSFNQSVDLFSHWPATTDVTAYLVTKTIWRERPVLRALFHFTQSGRDSGSRSTQNYQNLCVLLVATCDGERRISACNPSSRESTCLAEMVIPHRWWPPLVDARRGVKVQKKTIAVEYAVAIDVRRSECNEAHVKDDPLPQLTSIPLWHVPLSPSPVHYSEVMENGSIQILVPRTPLFPRSKLYVPVYVRKGRNSSVNVFVMRAKSKSGLRILEAEAYKGNGWSITADLNSKRTVATVTAFCQDPLEISDDKQSDEFKEAFSWLLEVEDGADFQRSARIAWSIRYVQEAGQPLYHKPLDDSILMTTDIDVQKDDIQSVLLVSKTWELVNTAVLNRKQVSLPIKVFVVSQAGKVGDVTLQSSCSSGDESILKVSPSCISVYLDGSEVRGSHNASVIVKYATYVGHAYFKVWLPEFPLDVHVEDERLSQIRNWKAPKDVPRKLLPRTRDDNKQVVQTKETRRSDQQAGLNGSKVICRLRYQQTAIDVYAKFIAVDDNSGRESYLLNRKSAFRVTELVEEYIRIADSRIASLKGHIIQGQSMGRTEVQILSPITGRVIGARELRVGRDKESITGLRVSVVTGLQLSIKPNYDAVNGFVAETTITNQLTAQYQEGLLDVGVVFSDGMSIQLSQLAEGDFSLALQASEHNVVALAPAASLHWPRVIALGEGNGSIHVSLEVPEGCSRRKVKPLTTATIPVIVKLKKNDKRISLQNDEVHLEKPRAEGKFLSGVHTIENRNDPAYVWNDLKEPLVQARQNPILHAGVSTLEIGMYALLGIFCLAISVFVASCAVYAVQFHKKQDERLDKNDPVANAHDWVWLGRATLERRAFNTKRSCSHETYLKCNNRVSRCNQGCSTHLGAALNRRSHVPVTGCKDAPERLGSRKTTDIESVANENANPFCDPELPSSPQRLRPHERRVQIVVNPLECQSTHSDATSQSDRGSPPPVPPHGRPMPSPRASSCCAPAMSATPLERQSWPPTESPINYDVMVEYFDNLKESNA